jgi:hypothetical protein
LVDIAPRTWPYLRAGLRQLLRCSGDLSMRLYEVRHGNINL